VERLVAIVDLGTQWQPERAQDELAGNSSFSQLCLRKLYVLCSRGAEPQGCLLQVQPSCPKPPVLACLYASTYEVYSEKTALAGCECVREVWQKKGMKPQFLSTSSQGGGG